MDIIQAIREGLIRSLNHLGLVRLDQNNGVPLPYTELPDAVKDHLSNHPESGGEEWQYEDADYTLFAGDNILLDNSSQSNTLTIPDTFAKDDFARVRDFSGKFKTNALVLTSTLSFYYAGEVVADDIEIDINNVIVFLYYDGTYIRVYLEYQGTEFTTISASQTIDRKTAAFVDTSSGSVTLTISDLPENVPVKLIDYKGNFGTNALILSSTIDFYYRGKAVSDDLTMNRSEAEITLFYDGSRIMVFEELFAQPRIFVQFTEPTENLRTGDIYLDPTLENEFTDLAATYDVLEVTIT